MKDSKVKEEANKFLEFLNSNESKEILEKYGFKVN